MALMRMIFRKMFNTRWLMVSWFIGLLITSALVSSVPIYTNGVLRQLLVQDLESQQLAEQVYPGGLYDEVPAAPHTGNVGSLFALERYLYMELPKEVPLPIRTHVTELDTITLAIGQVDAKRNRPVFGAFTADVASFGQLQQHIRLVGGRLPAKGPVHGVYEVLIPVGAMARMDVALNQIYALQPQASPQAPVLYVRPVGVFTEKDAQDIYWRTSIDALNDSFILSDGLFRHLFTTKQFPWLYSAAFYTVYDYHAARLEDIAKLNRVSSLLDAANQRFAPGRVAVTSFPLSDALSAYIDKASQLHLMMWTLDIPVLITLGVYMFMVSRQIVEREQNEIAVLRSRGATRRNIILGYLVQVGILGLVAFLLGPLLGDLFTQVVGASDGFLEFVQRVGLPVSIGRQAYFYSLWSLLGCLVMVLVAVYFTTNRSIVSHKQRVARSSGSAIWHKYFVDVLLLGVSAYGWTLIRRGHEQMLNARIDFQNGLYIDPLSFFVPALFVVGCSLFFLRIYPVFIRVLNYIGKKWWRPEIYLALVQVGRTGVQYQLLMVFLMMTVAMGTFSASAARTINRNLEEKILYHDGADVTLSERWQPIYQAGTEQYVEPSFGRFQKLPGVIHATRVFTQSDVSVTGPSKDATSGTTFMAIDPADFAQTAWFRNALLPFPWWGYCNLLAKVPNGALISETLADELQLKPGDTVTAQLDGIGNMSLFVESIVKYWPTFNPLGSRDSSTNEPSSLIVVNLPYMQQELGARPYDVWLKLKPGAIGQVYQTLTREKIPLLSIHNTNDDVIAMKHSAFLLGLNGTLTLGFLLSMFISFVGFLIYWLLSMFGRRLQIGVFRAIGFSVRKMFGAMAWEQCMTSVVACVIGGVIGVATSHLFVGQFELYFSVSDQVPPFQVIVESMDSLRLFLFVSVMLITGLTFIGWVSSRIRIHQAVKLGED